MRIEEKIVIVVLFTHEMSEVRWWVAVLGNVPKVGWEDVGAEIIKVVVWFFFVFDELVVVVDANLGKLRLGTKLMPTDHRIAQGVPHCKSYRIELKK